MKKLGIFVNSALFVISLNACTLHKPTPTEACEQAKRQVAFNASNPSHLTSQDLTNTQQKNLAAAANC